MLLLNNKKEQNKYFLQQEVPCLGVINFEVIQSEARISIVQLVTEMDLINLLWH